MKREREEKNRLRCENLMKRYEKEECVNEVILNTTEGEIFFKNSIFGNSFKPHYFQIFFFPKTLFVSKALHFEIILLFKFQCEICRHKFDKILSRPRLRECLMLGPVRILHDLEI